MICKASLVVLRGSLVLRGLASACVLALSLTAGGCSFGLPVSFASADAPDEPASTGTVTPRKPVVLAAELGPEDWRRASAALAVALDPQGNGKPVKWENPETEMRGTINPAGPPFVQNDEICRLFHAEIGGPSVAKDVRGTACKPSGGEWSLKQVGGGRPGAAKRAG